MATPPSSNDSKKPSISNHRLELQHTAPVPLPPVVLIAATTASGIGHATPVGVAGTAARTDRPPTRWFHRNRIAVANAYMKPVLGSIDCLHPFPKAWTVALPLPQDQIHPGVDHLVTQGAFRGLHWQRLEQRLRQHNLTAPPVADAGAPPIEPSGAAHAAVTPTHGAERLTIHGQGAIEMLAVEAMKNRQQRQQRHGREGCGDAASSCRGQSDSSLL